jgi:hypothetical protein
MIESDVIAVTISYYLRLVLWITILFFIINAIGSINEATVSALKPVVAYCLLLGILIILKLFKPNRFEDFRWFCTPAIIFLKSWTSLFFFVYLVELPIQISSVAPVQIVSWIFQIFIGNVI